MSKLQRAAATALIVLLVASLWGLWATRPAGLPARVLPSQSAPPPANAMPVIDQNTYLQAKRLANLARTPEEEPLALAAFSLADHELDLAFTGAMHHVEAHPPVLSAQAQQIQGRLNEAQKVLTRNTARVKELTDALARASDADKAHLQDQLLLAQSQLELQQDHVQWVQDDLMQAGGNAHQRIQAMQQEHEATEHNAASAPKRTVSPLETLQGLVGQVRQWSGLHDKRQSLLAAQHQVQQSVVGLLEQRRELAARLAASGRSVPQSAGPAAAAEAGATLLSFTRQRAADEHRLTIRDQRIRTRQHLAEVYGQWAAVIAGQARTVLHAALISTASVLGALLLLLFADRWLGRLLGRARIDRRQIAMLRSVVGVALQIVAVVVILVALVGMPGQTGTMLGIAGAGLTVALKDFIVAFIGWFVLMGRNGMRLGDWVEINGVSGEVVELGMFHTVLLETGNWTDAGHPTGRHVTFTNSFAIEGHYFNFSTSGQWLWDELTVMVPYGRDPQAIAAAIQKEVVEATADSTHQAEQEWRASRNQRGVALSAQPGIAVRPAPGGVEIAVRYVTRASERFAVRAKLYQAAVQLLAQQQAAS